MQYELFNTTASVRELPKYNYKGVITLQPNGTYPIEDFMTKFYLPYVPSGIAIRTIEDVMIDEVLTKVEEKPVKEDNKVDIVEDSKEVSTEVEDAIDVVDVVDNENSDIDIVEEVKVEESAPRKRKYRKRS